MKCPAFFIFLIILPCLVFSSGGSETKSVSIYYTSSLNGNIDGCNCASVPKAGLVKRGYYLGNLDLSGSLVVESGDIFDVYSDPLLHSYILDSYKHLGYDVIAVGDQEFSEGIPFLLENKDEYPFLSNNLMINGIYFSVGPFLKTLNGINAEVFSVIDPSVFSFYPEEIKKSISVDDPVSFMSGKPDRQKITVVIFHGRINDAENLASAVDGIDIIILGHEQLLLEPEKKHNTYIVSPGDNGNYVGRLELEISAKGISKIENSFRKFSYKDDPDDETIRQMIIEYYENLKAKVKS